MAPRFSIGIPSNRPLATSKSSIASAHAFCERNGYNLVVSDNSGDAEKAAWLRGLMTNPNMKHIDSPPCGMMDNWFQTFNATSGEYVLMMGDDDTIFAYENAPKFDKLDDDVIAVRPAVMGYGETIGIVRVNTHDNLEEDPMQRVMHNLTTAQGANLALFSFWRRDIIEPIMNLWHGPHPTKGTYCDWAIVNALTSSGRTLRHPAGTYFYNLQNWMGNAEQIQKQIEAAFTKAGLPEGTSRYDRLLNAIDSFIFINRKMSPVAPRERFIASVLTMQLYIKSQLDKAELGSHHANQGRIDPMIEKLRGLDDIPQIFALIYLILDEIQPGLAARYDHFHREATGYAWGDFTAVQSMPDAPEDIPAAYI